MLLISMIIIPNPFVHLSGVLEGRRIPPPALTPLQNAPRLPTVDSFDKMDKKKKKKKKEKDRKDGKSPPPKPENPSDIPPPRGFAAPLHPHMQGSPGRINSAAPLAPRYSKGTPQMSDSRYFFLVPRSEEMLYLCRS